jgi:hypothetical protein
MRVAASADLTLRLLDTPRFFATSSLLKIYQACLAPPASYDSGDGSGIRCTLRSSETRILLFFRSVEFLKNGSSFVHLFFFGTQDIRFLCVLYSAFFWFFEVSCRYPPLRVSCRFLPLQVSFLPGSVPALSPHLRSDTLFSDQKAC